MDKIKIYYLCNKKQCPSSSCNEYCHHTSNIEYAANYRKKPTRRERIKNFIRLSENEIIEKKDGGK